MSVFDHIYDVFYEKTYSSEFGWRLCLDSILFPEALN